MGEMMRQLVRSWQRGASVCLLLAALVAFGAAATFVPFAAACEFALWLGASFLEDPVRPGEVWWARVVEWWQLSGVIWVPITVSFAWPHIAEIFKWRPSQAD